ncbi:hypothetical protein HNP46_005162 [Pseudomonas nitritireducens]|uniref:PGDYG protein n=1 Tax=Pseudomonas nitroreducens TaxID=46680 RepID=A0A7W7P4G3_PSENT|nr:PGDYG domain-containing protein [Pseudomonas nitritireducens]MBB4866257.1 hypothetical protein [Pseudomonas nitritireducens]
MLELTQIDLAADPAAQRVVKDETVTVKFAAAPGELISLEGPNRYAVGDAIICAASGERWVVSRERFDPKYRPADAALVHGQPGAYRNVPTTLLGRRMDEPFTLLRSAGGDRLTGAAGDWVLQYAPGDYGVIKAERFAKVYRLAD